MDERNDYNSITMQPIQTAIDWLFLMLNNPNRDQEFANKLLKRAKQMEKQQMLESSISGSKGDSFEQYYNQTYNKT